MESIWSHTLMKLCFPLYQEELEFKQKHNAETLLNLFDDEDLIPIVNIHRRNYG